MSSLAAILLGTAAVTGQAAPAAAPAAAPGPNNVTVRASARIVAGTPIRQGRLELREGPHIQIRRDRSGRDWIEFT